MQEMCVWSLGQEDLLEEGMTAHSSILAWRIPQTAEPGGLQFMGSQKSWTQLSDWTTATVHMGRCTCFWNLEWGCRSLLSTLWGGLAQGAFETSIKDHHLFKLWPLGGERLPLFTVWPLLIAIRFASLHLPCCFLLRARLCQMYLSVRPACSYTCWITSAVGLFVFRASFLPSSLPLLAFHLFFSYSWPFHWPRSPQSCPGTLTYKVIVSTSVLCWG